MRVLIADDNPEIRSALGLVLCELWPDCVTVEARDAGEVAAYLEALHAGRLDLVLLDWELPGIDAPRFIRHVGSRFPGCLVIAMSSRPEVRNQSLAAGAAHFVGTNDPPQQLVELLRSLHSPASGSSV